MPKVDLSHRKSAWRGHTDKSAALFSHSASITSASNDLLWKVDLALYESSCCFSGFRLKVDLAGAR